MLASETCTPVGIKQTGKLQQGVRIDQSLLGKVNAGANGGIKHPHRHTLARSVWQANIYYVAFAASGTKGLMRHSE